ncbi:MAG: TAXI family TRAP transporter solute-binding subunit, partial [Cyanothece sp. SIO1E1]|nr:TAXI family TRAP transporter solute-binding subunit [Cyanothece sp. SIO1E1]
LNLREPIFFFMVPLKPSIRFLFGMCWIRLTGKKDICSRERILMPQGSGSYHLFWPLSQHYGLSATDFEPVLLPPTAAQAALRRGAVDALFQVISLGSPALRQLLAPGQARLIAIQQAAALKLSLPYIEAAQIPAGTYNGAPSIPTTDLPTVAVQAVLMTHQGLPQTMVYEITQMLHEARHELARLHPQATKIELSESIGQLRLPIHKGAKAYYNQDKPNFLVQYAEPLGLLLSIAVLVVSGIWQFRLWLLGRQKNRADMYNLEILGLIHQVNQVETANQLECLRAQLFEIFQKVVVDLDEDRISPESFQSFTFPWEVAITTIRHRELLLMTASSQADGVASEPIQNHQPPSKADSDKPPTLPA